MSDDRIQLIPDPATDDTLSPTELILLSLEHRFGRMATALEKAATAGAVGANNLEALTAQVHRLADAFESAASTLACITDSVECADGVYRCIVRTRDTPPHVLSFRDDRE